MGRESPIVLFPQGKILSYATAKNFALIHKIVSLSGGLHPQTPYRGLAMDPSGDFRPPDSHATSNLKS